jgi:hypothetical protein
LSTCSRSPGANLEPQPAFWEYFVSLMRVFSSMTGVYLVTRFVRRGAISGADFFQQVAQRVTLVFRQGQGAVDHAFSDS